MNYMENNDEIIKKNKIYKVIIKKRKIMKKKINIGYKNRNQKPIEKLELKNNSSIKIINSKLAQNNHDNNNNSLSKDISEKRLSDQPPEPLNEILSKEKKREEILTDYELNDLDYSMALELDDRNFFKTYWYLLKREHIIIFTFFNKNDYNIFSIKLSKLFLAICSDMAFNVFFFADETMYNIYVSGGTFVGN